MPELPAGYLADQSPDGQDVMIDQTVYALATGRAVSAWPKGSAIFTSSGAGTCGVRDDQPSPHNVENAKVFLWAGSRKVTALGFNGRFGAPTILACSITDGYAVVESGFGGTTPVAVYRLADGKVLWQLQGNGQFAVSDDARVMAVVRNASIRILSLPSGREIGSVAMNATPIGFSGDGSRLAVTVPSQPRFQCYVIEWTTGVTLWSHVDGVAIVRSQPGGPGMIVMTPHISSGPHQFWLIPASGRPLQLAV